MQDRHRHSQHAAAARAGFSERTGRRIDADPRLPSQRQPERGRTVPDPLEAVWEPMLLPILKRDEAVQAVTLLRHLQMTDPDAFPDDRVRRTLERRVRDWRALHGAARAAIALPWSNGQTEGQICKLKKVKRQMYGQGKLDLLKARLTPAR